MNDQLVLVIESDANHNGKYSQVINQHIRLAGLSASKVEVTKAADRIKELTAARLEPAVALIEPNVPGALAVARRIRSVWPLGQMLFVTDAWQLNKLQGELSHAPMIGPNWSLVDISDPGLPGKITKSGARQPAALAAANNARSCERYVSCPQTDR